MLDTPSTRQRAHGFCLEQEHSNQVRVAVVEVEAMTGRIIPRSIWLGGTRTPRTGITDLSPLKNGKRDSGGVRWARGRDKETSNKQSRKSRHQLLLKPRTQAEHPQRFWIFIWEVDSRNDRRKQTPREMQTYGNP